MTLLRAAAAGDAPALAEIWRASFDDGEDYIEDWFSHRFVPEQVLLAEEGGAPASMLTALPLTVLTDGGEEPAYYIYAVATAPKQRGRGLSTALLEYAHTVIKKRGAAAELLVPSEESLLAFYGSRGYLPACDIMERRFAAEELCAGGAKLVPVSGAEYAALRDDAFSAPGYFRWGEDAVEKAVAEAEGFGGGAFYFSTKENEGAALCAMESGELLIKELAMAQPDEGAALAAAGQLAASFGARRVTLRTKPDGAFPWDTRPFAMYRPLREGFALPAGAYFGLAGD